MKANINKEHLFHYLVLLVIINFGVAAFFLFSFDKTYQMITVGAMGIIYILWGILHHYLCQDLHLKVVLEYVLISLLSTLIVFSLLLRS